MRKSLVLLAVIAIMATPALAVQNRLLQTVEPSPPQNFTNVDGDHCSDPGAFIGGGAPVVVDVLSVGGTGETVSDLGVGLGITHLWVGDLIAEVESPMGTTATIMDQPGLEADPPWGCGNPNVDATLIDGGSPDVEDQCEPDPAITGTPSPSPDALSTFAGEDFDGDWTITLTDGYEAFSDGTFDTWCLTNNYGAGGDGGTGTPATSTWGVIAMIVLFLAVSLFFLRRRATA